MQKDTSNTEISPAEKRANRIKILQDFAVAAGMFAGIAVATGVMGAVIGGGAGVFVAKIITSIGFQDPSGIATFRLAAASSCIGGIGTIVKCWQDLGPELVLKRLVSDLKLAPSLS